MNTFGTLLAIVGFVVAAYGAISLLVMAFHEGIGWGLGCLFVPIVALIFAIMYWDEAKKPFLINVGGGVLMAIGAALSGLNS